MTKKTKKQLIVEEAAILIRDKGYAATTMRDLAARVGMEAASLYNHITSKEDILKEICFSLADSYTTKMEEVYHTEEKPIHKIKKLVDLHIQINKMTSPLATVMNDEWRHLNKADKSNFLTLRHDYEAKFIDIIEKGIKAGELKQIDPKIALFTILSSVRWLQHWYYNSSDLDYQEINNTVTAMIFGGITNSDED